jgi:UDP-3-O-[3-hydroxymyristoyl] glucosamine N-acyltransferase
MSMISSKAVIDPCAHLAVGVSVGHFTVIEDEVIIGENCTIAESVIIRQNVRIGRDVLIHPHVVVNSGTCIGDRVEIFPCAYIGKEPKGAGTLARQPIFEKRVVIEMDSSIGPHAVIYYDVEIGEHTLIGDGASIREQCRIGSYSLISRYVTVNYNAKIGNKTRILDFTHITGNCTIGNNVFISTMIATTNDNALGREGYSEQQIRGPIIEDGAMIAANVTLLPGVRIGEKSVIGAGAVVTKDVPPGSVMMGVPAKESRKV